MKFSCLDSDSNWNKCHGTYTFPDGTKYVGEWKDNKPNGQGTFTESNSNQSIKTFTYPDGSKYVGEYKNNKRSGQGSMIFACGDEYVGAWKDDKNHGQGTFIYPDGRKVSGEWRNGKHFVDKAGRKSRRMFNGYGDKGFFPWDN
jgi:hypothetical protein